MEKDIQIYIDVNEAGEIVHAQMGKNIVATDPFPFFFMIDDETASRIAEDVSRFRVEIKNFRPQLIELEEV